MTVFITVFFNPLLRDFVYLVSPARIKSSQKLKPFKLDKLTDYLLSSENVRFIVYGGYAIALILTNIYNFQDLSLNKTTEFDKAILQSFITFIAFERAFSFMKQLEFRPSRLIEKIAYAIRDKIDDNE